MDAITLYEIIIEAAFASGFESHNDELDERAANAVLAYGGDINEPLSYKKSSGVTMLYASTMTSGSLPKTLRALKARGADGSNLKFMSSLQCMRAVLDVFPEVSFTYTFENGQTPLHIAAAGANHEEVIRFFLTNGASKTKKDNEGHIPFDMASQNISTHASRIRDLLAVA
jgi:ankyrin repeat protein